MTPRALLRYSNERMRAALASLIEAQDADGLWRDYALNPGPSEAWSTSWIGWHVAQFAPRSTCLTAVWRAVRALRRVRAPGGWGYNRRTEVDADSTAWALRLIRRAGVRLGLDEGERLSQFVDRDGRAHTFADTRNGTWADAHDDVTPVLGLALLACDSRNEALKRVRVAVIDAQRGDGLWTSFWWASEVYASFWSIYFLRRTGGLPHGVSARVLDRLYAAPAPCCALEDALWLLLALELGQADPSFEARRVDRLLEASGDRGWPGSPLLLVPTRFEGDVASPPGPHADERGLMTTAAGCWALARWAARVRAVG